jgi:hypothetical protein
LKAGQLRAIPLYPLLAAGIPTISLFVINREELILWDILRPLLVALSFSGVTFLLAYVIVGHARRAALPSLFAIIGALIYDQAFLVALSHSELDYSSLGFFWFWASFLAALFLAFCLRLRRSRSEFLEITVLFNLFALFVLIIASYPWLTDAWNIAKDKEPGPGSPTWMDWEGANPEHLSKSGRPDIYFIVLDAYARDDILQTRFNFDNSNLIRWLDAQGFFIGWRSHANYPQTHYSLASTLNAQYLDSLIPSNILEDAPDAPRQREQHLVTRVSDRYIKKSRIHDFLRAAGYQFIANESGYTVTRKIPASATEALSRELTEFERELLKGTLLHPLFAEISDNSASMLSFSESILSDIRELGQARPSGVPTFYFYHLLCPHFPFSFNEDGSTRPRHPLYDRSAWIEDRVRFPGYIEYYREQFPKNVAGLNVHLREMVESMLENTNRESVIIIQADHGSSLGYTPGSIEKTDLPERFGILNAIFLPKKYSRIGLRDDMSSVNTFPVILHSLFGLDLPQQEDRAFLNVAPMQFEEITQMLGQ